MAIGKIGKSSRFFVWIILALIIVGLVGFGATGISGTVRSIGSVGDAEMDVNRYARELDQELRALGAETGQTMTLSQARTLGLDQAVLQRMIATAALENETSRIGLSVGDEEVRRQVLATPAFRGLDGEFDREAYEFTLDRTGSTPAIFEETVRAEVASNILQNAVAGGVAATDAFGDTLVGYIGERRNFSWLELTRADLNDPLSEPGDEELRAHYEQNIADFTLPESKKLTYVWLAPEMIVDQVPVDEDALRALYKERDEEFNTPERRLVERLVFGTADEAAAAMAKIQAGEGTFAQAVAERGLDLADIDLGDVSQGDLGAAGADVFALTQPGLAGPVTTDLGPAIIRVNAILGARSTPYEDARTDLVAEYAADHARRQIGDLITEIDDLLAGGATLEEIADETDMELGELNWVQGEPEGIAAYVDFDAAAAAVTAEDFPEVGELDDGGIFALRLDEIVAPSPEPFDDAVIRVIRGWEISEISKRLTAQGEELKSRLDGGASIGSLGLPAAVETHVTRSDFIEGTTPAVLAAVFELAPGESAIQPVGTKVIIAQLSAILPPAQDDPDVEALKATIRGTVAQGISQDILAGFTRAMETQGGISLNQAAINAVHAQFP